MASRAPKSGAGEQSSSAGSQGQGSQKNNVCSQTPVLALPSLFILLALAQFVLSYVMCLSVLVSWHLSLLHDHASCFTYRVMC